VIAVGDPVQFVWGRGGVQVSIRGVALNAARPGEPVRARAPGRAGSLTGTATAPGLAMLVGAPR
jgi:flagella basal body P-ring formation protein FlgA